MKPFLRIGNLIYRLADFPKHPDTVIFPETDLTGRDITEEDIWTFYTEHRDVLLKQTKGKNVTQQALRERDALLRKIVKQSDWVQIPENYSYEDYPQALENSLEIGGEGLVFKPLDSPYVYGPAGEKEKKGTQVKFKPGPKAHIDEVFVESYTLGKPDAKGYKKAVFPAYQWKDDKPFEVGKLSGLPREIEEEVKGRVDTGKQVVIEVSFQE
jgi:ATP-dependent DNA ligase